MADQVETETVELKQESSKGLKATWGTLADAAVCLANHLGGTIVVGIADRVPGPAAFVGSSLETSVLARRVWELTTPQLAVSARAVTYREIGLVAIDVLEGPDVHATTGGPARRRFGTTCPPMSPREIAQLREEKLGIDWSAAPSRTKDQRPSPRALETVRARLRRIPDERSALARLDDEGLVAKLGLLARPGRLNRAGARLLTTPRDADAAVVYHLRSTPGGEPTSVVRLAEPIVVAYERALELIGARNTAITIQLERGAQIEIFDFPTLAIEEALANALIHRDFRLPEPVVIDHSPEVLSITSPGPLVHGVTRDNILTHHSKPRNRTLATAARLVRLAEEVGQGVDRMYRAMLTSGRSVPAIETSPHSVTVTLTSGAPNRRLAVFIAESVPADERDDVDTLLVLGTLLNRSTLDAPGLAPIVQKTAAAAETVLRRLSDEQVGLLEPTRGTYRNLHPRYRLRAEALRALGPAVAYNRRTEDEIDRKIAAHVREYGRIKNRTVRDLFDVDVNKAKDILAELVQRGVLVKAGQGARGPGVEYLAGAAFPRQRSG